MFYFVGVLFFYTLYICIISALGVFAFLVCNFGVLCPKRFVKMGFWVDTRSYVYHNVKACGIFRVLFVASLDYLEKMSAS